MALSKTVVHNGVAIQDAYIRVGNYQGSKSRMSFSVQFKADADSVFLFKKGYECDVDLSGDNAVKQAYQYLKTLSEFTDAEDV